MNYPLISDYISSILSAEDNLATKTSLRPVLNSTGDPIMTSGNFAVVFKMVDINDNKNYAMKCFLRDQEGREESYIQICETLEFVESRYLLKTEYLPGELFVDTNQSDETEFPVLLMEWVEGNTLGSYIADNYSDSFKISQLAYNFSKMASWLLSQDFAHGDIKPDNIIVKENGNLVLVDYDGMYVPSMKGSIARENGSPNFRHPERTDRDFDEHIDDFSLAVLNLTLKVLSLNIDSISTILDNDYCIFNESDYGDLYNSTGLYCIESHLNDHELQKLWGLFLIALSDKKLSSVSFRLSGLTLPSKEGNYSKLTELTDDEKDRKKEPGIIVDRSGKRLIAANVSENELVIPEGIEIICGAALQRAEYNSIVLPESIKAIGGIAFANIENLEHLNIPKGVVFIEKNNPIGGCINLHDIRVDSSSFIIDDDCLYSSNYEVLYASLFSGSDDVIEVNPNTVIIAGNAFWQREIKEIVLPKYLSIISGSGAFGYCKNLKEITIPEAVKEIGNSTFINCESLERISIPNSVLKMGSRVQKERPRGMFQGCESLKDVSLPTKIEYIGEFFFRGCSSLEHVVIPESVQEIGACAFEGCSALQELNIPPSVKVIRDAVFRQCHSLRSIYISDSVKEFDVKDPVSIAAKPISRMGILMSLKIGSGMFSSCLSLEHVRLPKCLTKIGIDFFKNCGSLTQVDIPDAVTEIAYGAFSNCGSLSSIKLPQELKIIHKSVFENCTSLTNIVLPDGLLNLKECAFDGCEKLKSINLPSGLSNLDGNPFPGCFDLSVSAGSDAFIIEDDSLYSFDKATLHAYWGKAAVKEGLFDGVICLDRYCFSKSRIESISIPETIHTIRDYAFASCKNLKTVSLNGISIIGHCVFYNCQSLEKISIPTSVTTIKESAFNGCKALKSIDIPDSVQYVGDSSFEGCESLTEIELPDSIEEITRESSTRGLFRDCKNLSVIKLNNYLSGLQEYDFKGCESISKILVPYGDRLKYRNKIGKYYQYIIEIPRYDDLPF